MRTSASPLAVTFSFLRDWERTNRHSAGFAPNLNSALFGRSDRRARKGARLARQTTPEVKAHLHARGPNFSRLQVEAAGADPEKPTARTACDDGFSDSLGGAYAANQG
jgi:hypothetical protein